MYSTDISATFIHSKTGEEVYIFGGPEFGKHLGK